MATGDTVAGSIRYRRETKAGEIERMVGNLSTLALDMKASPEKAVHFNPADPADVPADAPVNRFQPNVLYSNEVLYVEHLSSNLEEAVQYDADEFFISVVEQDNDTGKAYRRTLNVNDSELTSDPTTSKSSWVVIFQDTVPTGKTWYLSGEQMVAAIETS